MLHALNVETPSPGNSVANSPILPLSIGRRSFSNHRRSHTEHTNPNLLSKNCFLNSASANLCFNRYRLLYSLLISLKFIASTDIYCSILLPSLPSSFPRPHTSIGSECRVRRLHHTCINTGCDDVTIFLCCCCKVTLKQTSPKTYTCQYKDM